MTLHWDWVDVESKFYRQEIYFYSKHSYICLNLNVVLMLLYYYSIIIKLLYGYSLHEVGKYDIPATIDYILSTTNTTQLHYIGYSMGSCVFFIMASERPEYQPKIRSQISLAPVAFLSNTRSSLRFMAPYAKMLNVST